MKGVQLTKMAQELELTNLTPEIDLSEIWIKTAEINRPSLAADRIPGAFCKRAGTDHRLCGIHISDAACRPGENVQI